MILILTKTQQTIFKSIFELIEDRKKESNNNKKINVNSFSISKKCGKDYKTVKQNLTKLKEKICELES